MYLLILVLFGSVRASTENLRRLIWGLLAGASIVCLAGLTSRVLPNVWHTAPSVSNERLSYPVTYWNTLGLLAALGIVLAFHITCSLQERRPARILAAAVMPLLAATLFFTFSRGAIAAGAVGLVVYVLVARPSGLLTGALATLPATAALVLVAYHANLLDTVDPTTPAAVAQGHRVVLVAGICAVVCAGLRLLFAIVVDPGLRRHAGRAWIGRGARAAALGGVSVLAIAAILALGVPHAVAHDWSRFISGTSTSSGNGDLRARLSDPSNDGRTDLWRVALHGFSASPLHGVWGGDVPDAVGPQPPALRLRDQRALPLPAGDGRAGHPRAGAAADPARRGLRRVGPPRAWPAALALWRAAGALRGLGAARGGGLGLGDAGRDARVLRRRGRGAQPAATARGGGGARVGRWARGGGGGGGKPRDG